MITRGSTLSPAREAGVVYTKPWRVERVLDLAGTLPEKRLADVAALEPSAGGRSLTSPGLNPEHCPHPSYEFRHVTGLTH